MNDNELRDVIAKAIRAAGVGTDLRQRERAAWEAFRAVLDAPEESAFFATRGEP